jgi:hypothetical protein
MKMATLQNMEVVVVNIETSDIFSNEIYECGWVTELYNF